MMKFLDWALGPRTYSEQDLDMFDMLYGTESKAVVERISLKRSWFLNSCEYYDDGTIEISHTVWGWWLPYVKVHEFTHAVCFYKWPRLMTDVNVLRAEAAAFLGVAMWRVLNRNARI